MTKWKKENSRAVDFKSALKEGLSTFLARRIESWPPTCSFERQRQRHCAAARHLIGPYICLSRCPIFARLACVRSAILGSDYQAGSRMGHRLTPILRPSNIASSAVRGLRLSPIT